MGNLRSLVLLIFFILALASLLFVQSDLWFDSISVHGSVVTVFTRFLNLLLIVKKSIWLESMYLSLLLRLLKY